MGSVCIGVDIGQKVDPTAIAVVEIELRLTEGTTRRENYHLVRHLARLPLGTSYPDVTQELANVRQRVHARQHTWPLIWLDSTGVGQPVVDMMKAAQVPVTPVY